MKAVQLLTVLLLFFTNCAISQEKEPNVLNLIQGQVDSLEYVVDVTFKIEEDGTATVLKVDSDDPKLVEYVIKKLDKVQVSTTNVFRGKVMRYRFKFKLDPEDLASAGGVEALLIANFVPDEHKAGHPDSNT